MGDYFNIRYVKLHFTLLMCEDTFLPATKASAIRGGIGEMLLRADCIKDRNCESCDFADECIVQRMMSSRMELMPTFMTKGDSVGYVIECEDYGESYKKGDLLKFNLILFGKNIVYFSQYLNAVYALGMNGLGKNKSRFEIISVKNTGNEEILENTNVLMNRYKVKYLKDYVKYRYKAFEKYDATLKLKLYSPLTLKYKKELLKELNITAFIEALTRRLYIMNCFEGIETDLVDGGIYVVPVLVHKTEYNASIKRYSSRSDSRMTFHGVKGEMLISDCSEDTLKLLLAGEILHIGKNTSFGFGRYRVMKEET